MKILYLTNARIPTEKANGIQILKMCEAFRQHGVEVELLIPTRIQPEPMKQIHDIWQYYGIETKFRIRYLTTPDFLRFEHILPVSLKRCLYYFQCFWFSLRALLVTCCVEDGVYYSRSLQTIFLLALTQWIHRKPVYFEAHELHGDPRRRHPARRLLTGIMRWMLARLNGLVVITHRLKTVYAEMGAPERRICVASDGVDVMRMADIPEQCEARQRLRIALDKTLVCYTGHLFAWKGSYTLAESGRYLPDNYLIYLVGGVESDVQALQRFVKAEQIDNIVLTGYVPYSDVPLYLSAADILVLPNSAHKEISREYTSPLKVFEYMQACRPIIASDLPSIREVLRHKENAYLVPPDDPRRLAEGIVQVIQSPELSSQMTDTAYNEGQQYTWRTRAQTILRFLNEGKL